MAYHKTTTIFLFLFFISAASDSQPIYTPNDDIVLDCGSSGTSFLNGDPRPWIGDVSSKFFPSQFSNNSASLPSRAEKQSSFVADVPYLTARLSRSQFTYSFPLTPGHKFIRLYFYPASYYPDFDRSNAVFSVKAGPYTLLRDFNASVNADASGFETVFREFCMYFDGNDAKLDITFTPMNHDSYAFVSGMEIVSMPINLYYTPPQPDNEVGRGLQIIGTDTQLFPIENDTTLETVYRINIGGNFISSVGDTGMFRTWSKEDMSYLSGLKQDARPLNATIPLNFNLIPNYTAPQDVYRTARTMGPNATINKSYNLTWKYPVDPGFYYLLRLHFCEIETTINAVGDRVFLIYIQDMIAEDAADVLQWTRIKGIPYYKDYIVHVSRSNNDKKVGLSVKLQPNPENWKTKWNNVILNGIEIFKLNDSSGNLGGRNPDPPPTVSTQSFPPSSILRTQNSKDKKLALVISSIVGGLVFCVISMFVLTVFIFQRGKRYKDRASSDGASCWALFSFSMPESKKTRNSNLPSDLCRRFSLVEIKVATKDFDDAFIIGTGGFGNVYKGYIDDGATQVAIKRLKPGSKQGAHEFKTEIEMLSQLRHLHLVSLIGYCNDDNEMILIYDYMSRGTLRCHLCDNGEGNKPSLSWKQRLRICIDTAKGLQYHTGTKYTIIHRDVKSTNILLDEKWVAKVSDFGLSKMGPMNMSKTHISTVVKGSFGYIDPEYYRRQKLTEKSDVYSFGVVLCEILCGRPVVIRSKDVRQNNLADLVRRCKTHNRVSQIIDTNIKKEIAPQCLRKFIEIVMSCIQEEGNQRPSMDDVVWGLEFVLQLQENSEEAVDDFGGIDGSSEMMNNGEEGFLSDTFDENGFNSVTKNEGSSFAHKGLSRFVLTEIMELNAGR